MARSASPLVFLAFYSSPSPTLSRLLNLGTVATRSEAFLLLVLSQDSLFARLDPYSVAGITPYEDFVVLVVKLEVPLLVGRWGRAASCILAHPGRGNSGLGCIVLLLSLPLCSSLKIHVPTSAAEPIVKILVVLNGIGSKYRVFLAPIVGTTLPTSHSTHGQRQSRRPKERKWHTGRRRCTAWS